MTLILFGVCAYHQTTDLGYCIRTNTNVMVMFTNAFCIFCFRYCDCFANGEFCNNCNCTNCYNNLDHENDRQKAIKVRALFPCFLNGSRSVSLLKLQCRAECVYNALISSRVLKAFYCTSKFCSPHVVTNPLGLH